MVGLGDARACSAILARPAADGVHMALQVRPEGRALAAAHLVEADDGLLHEAEDHFLVLAHVFGGILAGLDHAGQGQRGGPDRRPRRPPPSRVH